MSTTPATGTPGSGRRESLRWFFGDCSFNESTAELAVKGLVTPLERRPLEILKLLLRHAGEVVTKEEILAAVWARRIVTDASLTKAISRLREVLQDDTGELIRTVHGYGYRLVGDVRLERGSDSRPAPELLLQVGTPIVDRPNWVLQAHLGSGGRGELWRGVQSKTGDSHVFKFARGADSLASLKREITLHRVLVAQLPDADHLVPLLDWNLADAPYFTEWAEIKGGNLRQWAERQGGYAAIPLEQRLQLMAQVAETLGQAHAIGVLHKDIKPSNILIQHDDGRAPKALLADFGSGALIDTSVLEALGITRLGLTQSAGETPSGTPLYYAPEVLAGQPFTTHSDLYALGVMLYQMVVADDRRLPSPGWERHVDDAVLRSDIAACVDGDPTLRIESALALAHRLRALTARREQAAAEARRAEAAARAARELHALRQRRRLWLTASACLLAGLVVSTALFLQARQARSLAQSKADTAERMSSFLLADLLFPADVDQGSQQDTKLETLLDRAQANVQTRFAGDVTSERRVEILLGQAYFNLGRFQKSLTPFERALALEAPTDRVNAERAAYAATLHLQALQQLGRFDQLGAVQASALQRAQSVLDETHHLVLALRVARASTDIELGHFATAQTELDRVAEINTRQAVTENRTAIEQYLLYYRAVLAEARGDKQAALQQFRRLADLQAAGLGDNSVMVGITRMLVAALALDVDRLDIFDSLFDSAATSIRQHYPETHPTHCQIDMLGAERLVRAGESAKGFVVSRRSLDCMARTTDAGPGDITLRNRLYRLQASKALWNEAAEDATAAVVAARKLLPQNHPERIDATVYRAEALAHNGPRSEALAAIAEAEQQLASPYDASRRLEEAQTRLRAAKTLVP